MTAQLTIANLYPLCMSAQGDEGNAKALRRRAELRGLTASIITAYAGRLPHADIYLLGGAWHPEQPRLVERLGGPDGLAHAVNDGAVVLGVNAGFQVLGEWFDIPDGTRHAGLGLLGARTMHAPLIEGRVGTLPNVTLGLPAMSGYESHPARTELDADVEPLARLEFGVGNGMPSRAYVSHGTAVATLTRNAKRANSGHGQARISNDPDPAAIRRIQAAANASRNPHAVGGPGHLANGSAHAPRGSGHASSTGGHPSRGGGHASHGGSHASIATDGAVSGHVIGTYLHGPVLASSPELADLLLGWALGRALEPLEPGHAGHARRRHLVDVDADRSAWASATT